MTFVQRLAAAAGLTEQRLTELLSECGPESGTRLGAAMRHALLGGGKRFRPFLLLESARLFGMDPRAALDAAAAFECVHCYSLVHDDLPSMDNDDLRRGQPTAHKAFDEWTAILAGDALLTLAFEIAARPQTHPDAGVRAELALVLAHAAGGRGMVLGQMLDLEAEKRGEPAGMSAAHVRRLQALKTGALIAAACEAGAVMAGAADDQRAVTAALRRKSGARVSDGRRPARCAGRCRGDGQGDRQGQCRRQGDARPPDRHRRKRAHNLLPRWQTPSANLSSSAPKPLRSSKPRTSPPAASTEPQPKAPLAGARDALGLA